jgi:hypothetical protein
MPVALKNPQVYPKKSIAENSYLRHATQKKYSSFFLKNPRRRSSFQGTYNSQVVPFMPPPISTLAQNTQLQYLSFLRSKSKIYLQLRNHPAIKSLLNCADLPHSLLKSPQNISDLPQIIPPYFKIEHTKQLQKHIHHHNPSFFLPFFILLFQSISYLNRNYNSPPTPPRHFIKNRGHKKYVIAISTSLLNLTGAI